MRFYILKFIILFACISSLKVFAQNKGQIIGKVSDAFTGQPVNYTSVILFKIPKDSLISGIMVDELGRFSFDNINFGDYLLKIKFLGYRDTSLLINLNKKEIKINLGDIKFYPRILVLKSVTITSDKQTIEMSIDRKLFNVSKDLSVKGGNGIDAVKNIPGVTIDADGSVALRNNSNVLVFIDGKQTALTLQQISADQIENIEVITNPSAKYDANSSGGILNVILKKNKKPSYSGNVITGIGTTNRYITTINLGLKNKHFDLSSTYSLNNEENNIRAYTYRENLTNYVPIKYFDQDGITDAIRTNQFGKVGLEYYQNTKNTIYIGSTISNNFLNTDDNQYFSTSDFNKVIYSRGGRKNNNNNNNLNLIYQTGYKRTFSKIGKEWSTNIQFTKGNSNGGNLFNTSDTILGINLINKTLQKNTVSGTNNLFIFQSDFVNPLNDSTKIEYGIKILYRQNRNINITSNYSSFFNEYLYDSLFSNDYLTKEYVNGVYINYTKRIRKINFQSGIRLENSNYQGTVVGKPKESFGYNYPNSIKSIVKSIFPAIYLSKKLNSKNEIQFNCSRKINRADVSRMIPIVMATDNFNYRIGNPRLIPEFITKLEFNYNHLTQKINYLSSLYGQYTENAFVFVFSKSPSNPNLLINTFRNGKGSFNYGWENIIRFTLNKIITISTTLTPYHIALNYIDENGVEYRKSGFSLNSKLLITVKLPKDFIFQLNGLYEAPKPLPQGSNTDLKFFDLSISNNYKKNIFFNLTLSDVLDSKQRGSNYLTMDYEQRLMNRREARFLKLTISYNFGKEIFSKKTSKFNPIENNEIVN